MFADVELSQLPVHVPVPAAASCSLPNISVADAYVDAIPTPSYSWLRHLQQDSGLEGLLQPPAATCRLRDCSSFAMSDVSGGSETGEEGEGSLFGGVDGEQSGSELGDSHSSQSMSSLRMQAGTYVPLSTAAVPSDVDPLVASAQHNLDPESFAFVPGPLLSYRRTYRSIITNDAEMQVFQLVDDLISESLRPDPRDEFLAQTSMAAIRGMAFFTNLPKEMQRMVQLQHHRVNDKLQRRTKRLQDDRKRKAGSDRSEGTSSPELFSPVSTPPRPRRRRDRRSTAPEVHRRSTAPELRSPSSPLAHQQLGEETVPFLRACASQSLC
jgi:hypothetical protein